MHLPEAHLLGEHGYQGQREERGEKAARNRSQFGLIYNSGSNQINCSFTMSLQSKMKPSVFHAREEGQRTELGEGYM